MALYLVELTPANPSKEEATALIETVNSSLTHGAELIETQVSADHKIVFVCIEAHSVPTSPQPLVSAPPSKAPTPSASSAQSSMTSRSSRRTQTTWSSGTSPQKSPWNST